MGLLSGKKAWGRGGSGGGVAVEEDDKSVRDSDPASVPQSADGPELVSVVMETFTSDVRPMEADDEEPQPGWRLARTTLSLPGARRERAPADCARVCLRRPVSLAAWTLLPLPLPRLARHGGGRGGLLSLGRQPLDARWRSCFAATMGTDKERSLGVKKKSAPTPASQLPARDEMRSQPPGKQFPRTFPTSPPQNPTSHALTQNSQKQNNRGARDAQGALWPRVAVAAAAGVHRLRRHDLGRLHGPGERETGNGERGGEREGSVSPPSDVWC